MGALRFCLAGLAFAALLEGCASAPTAPTRSAYDLVLRTPDGERFDFAQLQGKVALVYFFTTWCFPCLAQMKDLAALQRENAAAGFEVVAVGMDLEGRKVLAPFANASDLPFPVLMADDEVRQGQSPYGALRALPATFLLDRRGGLVTAFSGPADPAALGRAVHELLR